MSETKHTEIRLFGTAGAGKTTELKAMVENAVKLVGSENVILSSFSKTAARELIGRKLPVADHQVATLHAHAYRALGKPELAETKDWITEWNHFVSNKAEDFKLSGGAANADEPLIEIQYTTTGDRLLSEYNLVRAKMIDHTPESEVMRLDLKHFARLWESFKKECEILDFTDLISTALRDIKIAPNNPKVGFFDECQDFSSLELALVRSWAEGMEYVVMAGDDEQAIFEFKGASPEAFLKPDVPDNMKRILGRSWRVPKVIQDRSLQLIRQVKFRQEKNYEPRYEAYYEDGRRHYDTSRIAEGKIDYARFGFQNNLDPQYLVEDLAQKYLDNGKTLMFLASCSYQLVPLLKALRRSGLAFHNPYRKVNGAWNPLGQRKSATKIQLYQAATNREVYDADSILWTTSEFVEWIDMFKVTDVLNRGSIKKIEELGKSELTYADLLPFFKNEHALQACVRGDLDFLLENAKGSYESRLTYLTSIADKYGTDSLFEKPQIIVGTIHSVKGGEADTVVVCPDLSPQGYDAYKSHQRRDSVLRQFYVAMTRSFETLIIAKPSGNSFIDL